MNTPVPPSVDYASLRWFKATASSDTGACVEVADARPRIALRDSKNLDGTHIAVGLDTFSAFIGALRTGDL